MPRLLREITLGDAALGLAISFYLSGAIGIIIATFWRWYVTNSPEENPRVNSEELALVVRAPNPKPHSATRRSGINYESDGKFQRAK